MAVVNKDILLVDDDREIRVLMRKMLEVVGANVLEQDSVEGALKYSLASPPHLILLDLRMPKRSGFDFLKARNKSALLQQVPVVVVSGSRDKDSIYKAIQLGASDYVVKPLNTKTILQKVRKYLKDNSFFGYEFVKGEEPKVEIQMTGQITGFNKTSFKLETSVKIEENTQIQLQAQFVKTVECEELVLKTSMHPARYQEDKRFQNTVQIVGASAKEAKKIQEAMKKLA